MQRTKGMRKKKIKYVIPEVVVTKSRGGGSFDEETELG